MNNPFVCLIHMEPARVVSVKSHPGFGEVEILLEHHGEEEVYKYSYDVIVRDKDYFKRPIYVFNDENLTQD